MASWLMYEERFKPLKVDEKWFVMEESSATVVTDNLGGADAARKEADRRNEILLQKRLGRQK